MDFGKFSHPIVSVLLEQNPWWTTGQVPGEFLKRAERAMLEPLTRALMREGIMRYQMILGPRRVGKTTLMYQVVGRLLRAGIPEHNILWLRLDHPAFIGSTLGDLVRLMERHPQRSSAYPTYAMLDEIVYSDHWDRWLKTMYDEKWPVRVVATASATSALRTNRVESGIGRWEDQFLPPYSFVESLELEGAALEPPAGVTFSEQIATLSETTTRPSSLMPRLRRLLLVGGFPEILAAGDGLTEEDEVFRSQRVLETDAVHSVVYKDLPQSLDIRQPMKLERLLYLLAGQVGGVISPKNLSASLEMAQPTVDQYIRALESAFLILTLPNFARSEESVQRRGRKCYFYDGAVRTAALRRGVTVMTDAGEMGVLLENACAAQLRVLGEQTGVRVYHWRRGQEEVDLVYDDPAAPLAFEIASSSRHGTKGLRALQEQHPEFRGRCYLVYPEAVGRPADADSQEPGHLDLAGFLLASGDSARKAMLRRIG